MTRYLLTLLLLLPPLVTAETAVTAGYSYPTGEGISSGPEVVVRVGDPYYVWGSYSSHDHTKITQSMGDMMLVGLGVGSNWVIGPVILYGDAGVGYLDTNYRTRVRDEVIYYTFVGEGFGHPPFIENEGNFPELEQTYETENIAPLLRIGGLLPLGDRASVDLSYRFFRTEQYFNMTNPDVGGGFDRGNPDACGCLWEGTDTVDFSGFILGFRYRF